MAFADGGGEGAHAFAAALDVGEDVRAVDDDGVRAPNCRVQGPGGPPSALLGPGEQPLDGGRQLALAGQGDQAFQRRGVQALPEKSDRKAGEREGEGGGPARVDVEKGLDARAGERIAVRGQGGPGGGGAGAAW
ncbi:MAG: hypothetical protein IPJ28_04830 [Betaproteobacteria bacterium]|nr:hypothetical protein [Betaproteobacteria bacterium]